MPANGRRDLIRRLKVNLGTIQIFPVECPVSIPGRRMKANDARKF